MAFESNNYILAATLEAAADLQPSLARIPRLPPLPPATGPALSVSETLGGLHGEPASRDPRAGVLSTGFPISARPLRTPNARATFSSAGTASAVDMRFARLAGLLPRVVPLRPEDRVVLRSTYVGGPLEVYGRVELVFDAQGREYSVGCWVVDLQLPVDVLLGLDWAQKYQVKIDWRGKGGERYTSEIAKKVGLVEDVYIFE
ncbi:hypothetical protein CERSUDRAFT_65592 [Gelatoporia subvermispora B]|uniref:Uncharacterized protein n=1 Tax=Ceriporiopsis subvermispora (strain B) TaxID=914234 RepID=M2QIF5_CERS8|nr:hypothetical protein CERSUDRAFT_65592 [Gelatoporia subvermispora B]